jgi:hypothetical protein
VVLSPEAAHAVLDHRRAIKKPLTLRAAELLAKQFAKCPDPDAAADFMIARGWQGFEHGWMEDASPVNGHRSGYAKPREDPYYDNKHTITPGIFAEIRADIAAARTRSEQVHGEVQPGHSGEPGGGVLQIFPKARRPAS